MAQTQTDPKVLVIDDSTTMTSVFARLLDSMATVATANSGEVGLTLAREILPDLILLDVQMPGWDGFDVINELKLDPALRHIPVIFITAEVLPEIESHCLEAGGADYIAKPITPRVLLARVKTHLLIKQQADMLADQAFRDPLTGCLSSWAFAEIVESECARAAWRGWPTALLLVEIDHYEAYAAVYGHAAADDAVAAVVAAVKDRAHRPGDSVGRTGVTQFSVLLPQTSTSEAQEVADLICGGVRELGIRHSKSPSDEVVTVSVGGASVTGTATPSSLLSTAEVGLRSAQIGGGNRTGFADFGPA